MNKLNQNIVAVAVSQGEGNMILVISRTDFDKFKNNEDVVCMSCNILDKEATRTTLQTAMTFNAFDIVEDNDHNKTLKFLINRKYTDSEIEKINQNLIV